jgi:hypothetical protein
VRPFVTGARLATGAKHRAQPSGPFDRSGPHPDVVLVRRCSEPHQDGAPGPGNGVGGQKLLNAVFPHNPRLNPLRDGWGGDAEMPELLRLQTSGGALGETRTFGHHTRVSNRCPASLLECSRRSAADQILQGLRVGIDGLLKEPVEEHSSGA